MTVEQEDIDKVPSNYRARDCYDRLFIYHKSQGKKILEESHGGDDYNTLYFKLREEMPSSNNASEYDMDFIFGEVISGLMEWAYDKEDRNGIKTGAYAHYALRRRYDEGYSDEEFHDSRKKSSLNDLKS